MTPLQYATIEPGTVIERYSDRQKRIVLTAPKPTSGGSITGIALLKIGKSWTNPNPSAWYEPGAIMRDYAVTQRRAPIPKLARLWLIENGYERKAALAAYGETL